MSDIAITISRQYGSGGREIGKLVAEALKVPYYDRELLTRAAKESGICEELFETHDEKPTNSFLYSLVMDSYAMNYGSGAFNDMPLNHKVFLAQFDTIKKIADEGSCVIVGRCADYALADYANSVHVFVYAPQKERIERVAKLYDVKLAKAKEMVQKTDKSRASYYNYYTSKKWGDVSSYDLCINSAKIGVEHAVEMILDYVKIYEKRLADKTTGIEIIP